MQTYGLIGWQIKHSLSPSIHNQAFENEGLSAHYTLYDIQPSQFEQIIVPLLRSLSGANVTTPYKKQIMPYLDRLTASAKKMQAVNTIYRDEQQRLVGTNTDGDGFWSTLPEKVSTSARVLLIGAGGAARAIMAAKPAQLQLDVANHQSPHFFNYQKQVQVLLKQPLLSLDQVDFARYQLIIDATTVGMQDATTVLSRSQVRQLPLNGIVIDLKYHQKTTPLMALVQAEGRTAFNGYAMLLGQASLSHEIWTHHKLDLHEYIEGGKG